MLGVQRGQESKTLIYLWVIIVLVLIIYVPGGWLSQNRRFDQDEFQHVHAAWCIYHGLVPYRDFFEHHMPVFYFMLAPLLHFFNGAVNSSDGIEFLLFLRALSWFVSAIILLLTFWLGKMWRNRETGSIGVIFLLLTEIYWSKVIEIRPDSIQVVFFLLFLISLIRATQPNVKEGHRKWAFVLSGLFLGVGFAVLQKLVYALPGITVAMVCYVFGQATAATRTRRLGQVASMLAGFSIPIGLTIAYFYLQSSLWQFLYYNFFFNLSLPGFSPYTILHQAFYQNPYLWFFGLAGLVVSGATIISQRLAWSVELFIASCALSLLVGLLVTPVPYEQYYLLFLPLLSLFAADLLLRLMSYLISVRRELMIKTWALAVVLTSVAVLLYLVLISQGVGSNRWPFLVPAYWLCSFLVCITLSASRVPKLALTAFLVAVSIPSSVRMGAALNGPSMASQVEAIKYVMNNTTLNDTVMDGFTGSGLFRRHAFFFQILPWNVRQRISDQDRRKLLEELKARQISPKLILFDHNLKDLSTEITEYFGKHYIPAGTSNIWVRKAILPVN